tara:strand:- start:12422 stop:12649 length:228 start_codon:yes stop_codon:yes gene_type:complete
MESLLIFCSLLSIILGIIQLFFPKVVDSMERYLDQLFHITEHNTISFRRVIGLTLIIVGVILIYSARKNHFITGI